MFSFGLIEVAVLVAVAAFIGGWRTVPRLLDWLKRMRLLRPDLADRMTRWLSFFSTRK